MSRSRYVPVLFFALMLLASCSGAKEQLGLTKKSPDEFQVVKRAPLAMPPDYSLRPPEPGMARPQETATVDAAREAVFGEGTPAAAPSTGNAGAALLQKAGATNPDPGIRAAVDKEVAETDQSTRPVIKRLMNIGKDEEPAASVVNPAKEAQRIKSNAQAGKPVTAGETPSADD
jgi:hypothetical protein